MDHSTRKVPCHQSGNAVGVDLGLSNLEMVYSQSWPHLNHLVLFGQTSASGTARNIFHVLRNALGSVCSDQSVGGIQGRILDRRTNRPVQKKP